MLLFLLLVVVALVLGFLVVKSLAFQSKLLRDFPAAPALPILGHVKEYWGDEVHIFNTTVRFAGIFRTRWITKVMDKAAFNLCDAEAIEAVMTSSKPLKKGILYDFLELWLGRGLLTNFGPSWHHRRKLLTPAFHFKILDEFGPLLSRHSDRLIENIGALVGMTSGPLDVVPAVSRATLGTICETSMGVDLHAIGKVDEYLQSVRIVGNSVLYRMIRPWVWRDFIFKLTPVGRKAQKALEKLHSFTRQVIKERKASAGEKILNGDGQALRKRRLAFLDMMLAAQQEDPALTDEAIREEVDTFMFEGHDTTAMAISWTLFALGNHPDIQQRVREEVLQAGTDWQSIVALPYLEMVIKESLRLYPPVLYIARMNESGFQIGDKWIPPGVNLDMHIFLIHRDPAYFPDPLRFDPERFSPDQERARHAFCYVPFSGGLRNCIGRRFALMELKLMVAAVVRHFAFTAVHSEAEIEFRPELVLRPRQGVLLNITPLK